MTWTGRWAGESSSSVSGDSAAAPPGVHGEAEQLLDPDRHRRPAFRAIVDRQVRACRGAEVSRGLRVEAASQRPRQQRRQGRVEVACIDLVRPTAALRRRARARLRRRTRGPHRRGPANPRLGRREGTPRGPEPGAAPSSKAAWRDRSVQFLRPRGERPRRRGRSEPAPRAAPGACSDAPAGHGARRRFRRRSSHAARRRRPRPRSPRERWRRRAGHGPPPPCRRSPR